MYWRMLSTFITRHSVQCCGSMTFWGGSGSGSADPCLCLMDPDPESGSCYFRHWPWRCQQKTNFLTQFFLLLTFWRYILHFFSKIKSQKDSQKSMIQGFSYFFCMMIEGSIRIRIQRRIRDPYFWLVDPDPEGKTNHVDPDPEHWRHPYNKLTLSRMEKAMAKPKRNGT